MSPDRQIVEDAINILPCMESSLRSLKLIFIKHEDLLIEEGMRHDLNNLWTCMEYIQELKKIQSECK